ncbi:MAG: hypothetical protein F6J89_17000 [Symploca sp. SIO1C4]|uniref:Cyanovirin-N domain-containing protein n=1 Tax=Symploca sp. SIO1C4 TaxID=2607765 RepID=A0A6B3NHZ8_9CYAN|nr:hypothetical protein [Symploca sp. SIO1C4]
MNKMTKLGNILKKTMKLMSLLALIFSLYQFPALAGDFSKTCKNISLENETIVEAQCKRISGNFVPAAVNLNNCIENRNGGLRFGGDKFIFTCKPPLLYDETGLTASCRNYDGNYVPSLLNLDEGITNNDGLLECD